MRISVDPGGTTGIAIRLDDGTVQTAYTQEVLEVYDLIAAHRYEIIILEDFVAQHIDGYMRHTIRLVGAVTGIAHVTHSPIAIQTPTTRKGFIYKAKQILGPHHVIHEVDAFAHLLAWESLNAKRPNSK